MIYYFFTHGHFDFSPPGHVLYPWTSIKLTPWTQKFTPWNGKHHPMDMAVFQGFFNTPGQCILHPYGIFFPEEPIARARKLVRKMVKKYEYALETLKTTYSPEYMWWTSSGRADSGPTAFSAKQNTPNKFSLKPWKHEREKAVVPLVQLYIICQIKQSIPLSIIDLICWKTEIWPNYIQWIKTFEWP